MIAKVVGTKYASIAKTWIPTLAVWGSVGGVALVHFTDWRMILDYVPYISSKFNNDKLNASAWRRASCRPLEGVIFTLQLIELFTINIHGDALDFIPVKRILNKPQIVRSLGNHLHTDVNAGHSRAGWSLLTKVHRSRHKHLYDNNHHIRSKPDLNTTLPVRQTASIFKQPVTKVTNHPNNKVKADPQKSVDQPKQLFWERKLSGLNAFDIAEELVKTMDLPKGLQAVGPVSSDKTLLSSIASALHTSPSPVTGQLTAAVEKNPGVWLNTSQPLCKAFVVTDDDIRKQEDLVQSVRRRLEEALTADILSDTDSSGGLPLMLHVAFEPIVVSRVTSVPCAGDGAACAWRDKGGGPGSGSSSREPRTTVFILTKKTTTILGFQLRSPAGKQNEDTKRIMDHDVVISSQHNGVGLPRETDQESRDEDHQEAFRFALDQLSLMAMEKVDCVGGGGSVGGGLVDPLDGTQGPGSDGCNGVGYVDLQMMEHPNGSRDSPSSCSPSPEYYGTGGYHMAGSHSMLHGEQSSVLCSRKRSVNMTECVPVPSSEHVAEIVGRQAETRQQQAHKHGTGRCYALHPALSAEAAVRVPYRVVGLVVGPKGATIKRIQQQTHTYIVTPSREKDPVFEVTGMPENVDRAREEIETHITLRTGTFVDLQGDNDFHSNGTDVSLEGLGALSAGLASTLWSRASGHHSAAPPPPGSPPPPIPMSMHHSSGRKMSSSAAYHTHNGGMNSENFSNTRKANESGSPTSPFSTGSSSAGGGFTFGGDSTPGLPSSDELGFEFSAANIWAPFVNGGAGNKTPGSAQQQPLRRNSSGLSGGAITPRLSPTLPGHGRGGSFSGASSSSSAGSSTGYSSCSASSLPGGSPTDSEGGSGGGLSSGMLSRLKGPGVAGLVGVGPGINRDCFVCFESEVTAALVPCGHNLFCMECRADLPVSRAGVPRLPHPHHTVHPHLLLMLRQSGGAEGEIRGRWEEDWSGAPAVADGRIHTNNFHTRMMDHNKRIIEMMILYGC
ncbi:Methyl-CpG-binding domain protein 3 [Dissostichus eleginoides]|uniref:Methyl-CpG-binding domain protein 3 n=1 Tax=Dissostichus eleginoides TaxID=100907 RepID=A0AAD9EW73_DISEL|nr:Methyl-CpG-binding domain protein 3 [Dissostichus eleginoides]